MNSRCTGQIGNCWLFTSSLPVVIFLDAEKLGDPFENGVCYPIFGPEYSLKKWIKEYPIALCIGYNSREYMSPSRRGLTAEERKLYNDPERIKNAISEIGLHVIYSPPMSKKNNNVKDGAMIAGNEKFYQLLKND